MIVPFLSGQALEVDGQEFVRNGLNPVAGMTQAHYLKGYFLLHYLMETVGNKQEFYLLLKVRSHVKIYFLDDDTFRTM